MSKPNRIRKVDPLKLSPEFAKHLGWQDGEIKDFGVKEEMLAVVTIEKPESPLYPSDWSKGALLNVRNAGETYNITLYPEEFDHRHPERTLKFTNYHECQNFVSNWYMRESHDPRAMR